MRLNDLVDRDDLARAVGARLVNVRHSSDGQRILNYSDAAMWTPGAWDNPAVRQCRGLIVDQQGNVAARPWEKFFNHGQAEAGELDLAAPVEVTDKMDGSLGILHYDAAGRPRVSTRGSFESDQAIHATDTLRREGMEPTLRWADGFTPLVEIIYPANRIVCDYGDRDELMLLGGVWIETGEYVGPDVAADLTDWRGSTTETFPYASLAEALMAPPRPGAEGFCVRYVDRPHIVKIKQEDYVALHRMVTGLSERGIWERMVAGDAVTDILDGMPDELHAWVRSVWDRLDGEVEGWAAATTSSHRLIRARLGDDFDRKDYALAAAEHPRVRPWLFNLLDGRDPRPGILKTLKPAGDTRFRPVTEDVA